MSIIFLALKIVQGGHSRASPLLQLCVLAFQMAISPSFLGVILHSLYRWKATEVYFPMQLDSHAKDVQNFVGIEKSARWSS